MTPTPLERVVLDDIQKETGLTFRCIGGINTRDRVVAEKVLPILAAWVAKTEDAHHRHAIYACFLTPHAAPYFETLVRWWTNEGFHLSRVCLTQVVASLTGPADAERIWTIYQRLAPVPLEYLLLSKLASFPSVASLVKSRLFEALQQSELGFSDLMYIAKVDDPRIRNWFREHARAANPAVRKVAKTLEHRSLRLPYDVQRADGPPDRTGEIFSTEVDRDEVPSLLRQLAKDLQLKIPRPVTGRSLVSALDDNSWVIAKITTQAGDPASIWLRLEDVDTVEVIVTRGHAANNLRVQ